MRFSFTAASERALAVASDWCSRTGREELDPQSLLVGLLSEPECRAAVMLQKHGIDFTAVCQKWPTLAPPPKTSTASPSRIPLSPEVEDSLQLACVRLDFLPRRPELATEHLLLGLVLADHEAAAWLRQQGLDPDAVEAEIRGLYGYTLPGAFDEEVTAAASPAGPITSAGPPAAPTQTDVLRVLDAAANRGREGLRVIEDYVRFVLDDPHLTGLCKQLRHDLTTALSPLSADNRMAARETQADVGTTLTSPSEQRRDDMTGVVRANFARLQESLRSLEEFGKLRVGGADIGWGGSCTATPGATVQLSPQLTSPQQTEIAASIKQLRYRVYTLERAVEIARGSIDRLAAVRLYVLIDGGESPEAFERLVRSLIDAGVHAIQLRDKRLADRDLLGRARLLRELCGKGDSPIVADRKTGTAPTRVLCIINDRPDLAALARADGVHIGQEEVSVKDARRIVGPGSLVGVSTHTIEQARAAVLDGANYIGVGPTFASETKSFDHFPGLELLRAVAAEIRLPAFAIGGINAENLAAALSTGLSRIAASAAITSAPDPAEAARQLLAALGT